MHALQTGGAFTINGQPFVPPSVPVLLQVLSGVKDPAQLLPQGSIIGLPANKVIELSLPGGTVAGSGPHPFHLHGVSRYSVLSSLVLGTDSVDGSTLSASCVARGAACTTTRTPCVGTPSA